MFVDGHLIKILKMQLKLIFKSEFFNCYSNTFCCVTQRTYQQAFSGLIKKKYLRNYLNKTSKLLL